MFMNLRKISLAFTVFCLAGSSLWSRDFSRFEVFGAYSVLRIENLNDSVAMAPSDTLETTISWIEENFKWPGGFRTGVTVNLNRYLGVSGQFGWNRSRDSFIQTSFDEPRYPDFWWTSDSIVLRRSEYSRTEYSLLAGPRFSFQFAERFRPYAKFLLGWNRSHVSADEIRDVIQSGSLYTGPVTKEFESCILINRDDGNSFSFGGGGGLDLKINRRLSIKVVDVEILRSSEGPLRYTVRETGTYTLPEPVAFEESSTETRGEYGDYTNRLGLSFGAVFHFGFD